MTNKRTEEQNESGGDTSQEDNFHAEVFQLLASSMWFCLFACGKCATEYFDFLLDEQADISDLDMWNRNVPSGGGLVAIASEGKTGCAEIISTHNLLQDSDNMDHLEKVFPLWQMQYILFSDL